MTPEQANNIITWWEEQTFPGKELFKLDETGTIVLCGTPLIKERNIATITLESADMVLRNLIDKYNTVASRLKEMEVEWLATDDKLKLADKVEHLKEFLSHFNAIGDFNTPIQIINEWSKTLKELEDENVKAKTQLAELAESLAESTLWKETAVAYKDLTVRWKQTGYVSKSKNDQLWNRIEAAKKTFHDRKRNHHDDEEKDFLQNLDLKIELAEQAEALANSENWKSTTDAYLKIVEQWKSIGRTLPRKNEELWQRIAAAKNTFFDRKKAHYAVMQQEHEVNLGLKIALVERAEALTDSTEWNATAQAYATLMEEWKKTGRISQEKGDELWKRFIGALDHFQQARKKQMDEVRAVHDANYKLKAALVKRAEEIKNSSRWGETTTEMNKLFDEWKKIGAVSREHHNTIWESFIGARKHFFNRKDAYRDQRKVHADAQKSARVEQAHAVVHKMLQEIAIEEEKLADFQNALSNITPGKKADELRTHLEVLISDSKAKMKRLKEKLEAGEDELRYIEEKERQEKEREYKRETEATNEAEAPADEHVAEAPKEAALETETVAEGAEATEHVAEAPNEAAAEAEPVVAATEEIAAVEATEEIAATVEAGAEPAAETTVDSAQ